MERSGGTMFPVKSMLFDKDAGMLFDGMFFDGIRWDNFLKSLFGYGDSNHALC